MGARSIADIIREYPTVRDLNVESNTMLRFQYRTLGDLPKYLAVYMPTREEYEITIEVIERAVRKGANLIVYDAWIKPTISGEQHANGKKINIYSYGAFINRVKKSQKL